MKDKTSIISSDGEKISITNSNNDEISHKNIELFEFLQCDDYLSRLFISKNCPGKHDYVNEFIYRNVSGTELSKMAVKKLFNKIFRKKPNNINNDRFINDFINGIDDNTICVFAPYGNDSPNDGYKKRILAIDNGLLADYRKIYLNCCVNPEVRLKIKIIDDKHSYIKFNSFDDAQINLVFKIINKVKITYTHSINMFMLDFTSSKLLNLFYDEKIFNILDVHGDVPNEQKLNGDYSRALLAEEIEKVVINGADAIICVSEYMKEYLTSKYKLGKERFLVLNIIEDFNTTFDEIKKKKNNQVSVIAFAGGLQKWQCLDQMIELVKNTKGVYNYKFYINNSEAYKREIENFENETGLNVETLSFIDLKMEYMKCDYGLLLRENNLVNNVACPTKLFEYIAHGIIPIINPNTISIINEFDIKYVTKQQLINNALPSDKEKEEIIKTNFEVYEKIINQNKVKLVNE